MPCCGFFAQQVGRLRVGGGPVCTGTHQNGLAFQAKADGVDVGVAPCVAQGHGQAQADQLQHELPVGQCHFHLAQLAAVGQHQQ